MARLVRGDLLTVEPGRVLDAPLNLDDFPVYGDRFEARKAIPYKLGDVIRSRVGRRALVIALHVERIRQDDPSSDLLPRLMVREETTSGGWSKQWVRMWPGDIERGYEAAQKREGS